jgi:tRNA threonylcarbamoyladenosine biosynthesis protein TsaE
MSRIVIESLEVLPRRVEQLIAELTPLNNVWAFDAPMGAGKTTIIREICKQKKVLDTVTSPTFSIINEYNTLDDNTIYHFDFYRLNSVNEALSIGVSDYFETGNLCLIEWPTVVTPILPDNYVRITIDILDEHSRTMSWEMAK